MDGRKRHISRHHKSSWRKCIDISEVEQFLEDHRQDERIDDQIVDKSDPELFCEEKEPFNPKATLREMRRRKFEEQPRSLLPLLNTSHVTDPIVKRNIKESRNLNKPGPATSARIRKSRSSGAVAAAQEDIWNKEAVPNGLKNEWFGKELIHHTLRNVSKPLVTNLPARMDQTQRFLPLHLKLPNEGLSYNPAIDSYLKLKDKVIQQERTIMKQAKHRDGFIASKFVKITRDEKYRTAQSEMSEGLINTTLSESDDEGPVEPTGSKMMLAKHKKYVSISKKRLREQRQQDKRLIQKEISKLMEIDRVAEITKELELSEQHAMERAAKRAKTKQILRSKIDMPLDFVLPEQLSESLRMIQPLNNLLATGLPRMRKLSILKQTRAATTRKKRRIRMVRYTHNSHKEPLLERRI